MLDPLKKANDSRKQPIYERIPHRKQNEELNIKDIPF
jgi:hypothetical protein